MDRFGDVIHLNRQLMMLFYRIFSMCRIEIGIQVYGPGRCRLRLTPLIQAILHSPLMVRLFHNTLSARTAQRAIDRCV
ncbi:hypothetical protein HanPI659440_Chr12g0461381 [Helianthus annuus]|nr:hypothetical protein HanPI659440_Chr12g0461381 [Helianthus annuus]